MKTFSTIIMAIAILAGLVLAITPFVADKFFPIPENSIRQAKPEAAAMALQQWFKSPEALFIDVQAINKSTPTTNTSWFTFSVGRAPVEKYILDKRLSQQDLNDETFDRVFNRKTPPASWWHPEALSQQTYFTGKDQGRNVSIIYNPDSKRGILVASTKSTP